ncbi:hypothetical protein TrCOL_g4667 [Triparma columacea]|uniref:Uncharacterized protein n=1 Tax=Triparma columacea TaxID=722753 RepID=A0A9W7GRE6_9STRA|nr:hypothetical protein TrCOL_g4667 [Triparma columacea]
MEGRVLAAVYNLGYLPNDGFDKRVDVDGVKRVQTSTAASLGSISMAVECLKVGGIVVVTSYPGSNEGEHEAVEGVMGCLSKVSSKEGWFDQAFRGRKGVLVEREGWRGRMEVEEEVKERVDEIVGGGGKGYRVTKNEFVGREKSPVLWCVARVK